MSAVIDPGEIIEGRFVCGVGGCAEAFDKPKQRGAHRRHGHPGWKTRPPGPVGDGVTDDTAAIQQLIDASVLRNPPPTIDEIQSRLSPPAVLDAPSPAPSPDPPTPVELCRCGHALRMHERLGAVDDRGACRHAAGTCMCSSYQKRDSE